MIQENSGGTVYKKSTFADMLPPGHTDDDVRVRVKKPAMQVKPTGPRFPGKDNRVSAKTSAVQPNVHNSAAPGHFQRGPLR